MPATWDRVRELYQDYSDTITLLVLDAELKFGSFPTFILNEIRAFTAHVSKLARHGDELSADQVEEEFRRASRHILRIKLDLHKILCVWFSDEYQIKFPNKYANVPLDTLIVNQIPFQAEFSKILMEALKLTRIAKTEEVRFKTADESLQKYEIAILKFRELEQFVHDHEHHIIELRRRYKKSREKDLLIGLLAGLVSSAIIGVIFYYLSKS